MNIFKQVYLQIINEWRTIGQQSLLDFPKSYELGLVHFKIKCGDSNQKDFERSITYTIGEPIAYEILDEGCYQILTNHMDKIKGASSKNLIIELKFQMEVKKFIFII